MAKKANSTLRKQFGARIRALREKNKLSQEDLGFEAEMDRTYVSGIERGLRNPSLDNIGRLAKALNVSMQQLFSL